MQSTYPDETKSEPDAASKAVVAQPSPGKAHLGYLDGLRALAALYVVAGHAGGHFDAWRTMPLPPGWTFRVTYCLSFGHFAVDVFIVLSGFCLMLPIVRGDGTLRGGVKGFLMRRARRILPPYYFAIALSLVLIWTLIGQPTGTHWDGSIPVHGKDILTHLALIQDALPPADGAKINHTHWSVAVEWHIYFLFPLLVLLWRRYGGIRVAAVTTLISYLAGVAAVRMSFLEGMHFQYVGLFALGMLGATIAFSPGEPWRTHRERLPWGILALGSFLLSLGCGIVWRRVHGITIYVDPLIGVSTALLLVALSLPGYSLLKALMEWRPLVFIGGFSYSLYLIHAPLLQVVWQYGIRPWQLSAATSFWLLAIVGGLFIVTVSYLFSLVCERPFMNSGKPEKRSHAVLG